MARETKITTDHEEIKKWALSYSGKPQIMENPQAGAELIGIRIDFPGPGDETYLPDDVPAKDITWDEFFKIFEEEELAFSYDPDITLETPWDAYHFLKRETIRS